MDKINIFWFRRDLRLDDNHGLYLALSDGLPVMPVFIFDPDILKEFPDQEDRRITFIYNTLEYLNQVLNTHHSSLHIFLGKPSDIFEKLSSEYTICNVFCNHDYEPSLIARDSEIKELLALRNIEFISCKDHVIFEKDDILNNEHKPYTVFTPYMKKWKEKFQTEKLRYFPSELRLDFLIKKIALFPELKKFGYNKVYFEFPGIELNDQIIRNYHLTRDYPYLEGTSRIGMHLRFGTVSVRKAVQKAAELNEIWLNELIWREFFIQILWHFPEVTNQSFNKKYRLLTWNNNEQEFEKWCTGKTGFPIIDAGMRELVETGHMHNRVRMITANFLTKILMIDWLWGERFFAKHLLDFELASNNGNWQWAAGTGADAAPYFRIFNPDEQLKKYDPDLLYVKKFVNPDSTNYPKKIADYKERRLQCFSFFKNGTFYH